MAKKIAYRAPLKKEIFAKEKFWEMVGVVDRGRREKRSKFPNSKSQNPNTK
jgi:hypothetical protein